MHCKSVLSQANILGSAYTSHHLAHATLSEKAPPTNQQCCVWKHAHFSHERCKCGQAAFDVAYRYVKESKVLFKVAGYADAAQQQADVGSVQQHNTPAAARQAGECFIAAISALLVDISGQYQRVCMPLVTESPLTTSAGEGFAVLVVLLCPLCDFDCMLHVCWHQPVLQQGQIAANWHCFRASLQLQGLESTSK